MKPLHEVISAESIKVIRESISAARGNEVFFLCSLENGVVTKAVPLARGNEEMVPAVAQAARHGDVVIHNHPSGGLTPSGADISIASSLADRGVGFFIVNNDVTELYVVVEPFTKEAPILLVEEEVSRTLGPLGSIAQRLEGYEVRPPQIDMAVETARAFNSDRFLMVEAGTGVGKSMAYLVPAVLWAVKNKERVVVSTNTINLQEQLSLKDIPFLKKAMGIDFKSVLVKGRGNYACLRKAAEIGKEPGLFPDIRDEERTAIQEWLSKTKDGSLSDLSFTPRPGVWEEFASEGDTCLRLRCSFYSDCFFNRARREAASADIIVANHHLLFSDLAIRAAKADYTETAVLPPYSRVVIDEAHNMEEAATSYFGDRVSRGGLMKQLGRLRHRKDQKKGLLPFIGAKISRLELPCDHILTLINGEISMSHESCVQSVVSSFDALYFHLSSATEGTEPEMRVRIDRSVKGVGEWDETADEVRNCIERMRRVCAGLKRLGSEISKALRGDDAAEKEILPQMVELKAMSERLEGAAKSLEGIVFGEGEDLVRWAEIRESKCNTPSRVTLHLSPVHVGQMMNATLFANFRTVIMTSATLTVKGGFGFVKERIGLSLAPPERVCELALPSPFNYPSQAVLSISEDLPDPTERQFSQALVKAVPRAVRATGGSTLVLFTSYALMSRVYEGCMGEISGMGYSVMKQGEMPRHELLTKFREEVTSVLFGTESFWEGIDVPGESLRQVIITRLPFSVPDDPVAMARQEYVERKGGNAFRDYQLPNAVLKFRQGFGRLIRSGRDCGVVLVLDKRLSSRSYGKTFMKSIPECRVIQGNLDTIIEETGRFIRSI